MKEYRYIAEGGNLLERFSNIRIFSSFDEEHLKAIVASMKIREYESNEVIIAEGANDNLLYILGTGKVRVVKNEEELAAFDQTGDVFGEIAVINRETRSATVLAATKTFCLTVDVSFMDDLSPEKQNACYAILYRVFASIIAERLKTTSEELGRVKRELEDLRSHSPGA